MNSKLAAEHVTKDHRNSLSNDSRQRCVFRDVMAKKGAYMNGTARDF